MIKIANDHPVTCQTCGESSLRRSVDFISSRGVRRPHFYDAHSMCLRCNSHKARVEQMDNYLEACDALEAAIRALPETAMRLSYGKIMSVDVLIVDVDACTSYTDVVIVATIGAFGFAKELRLEPRALAYINAADLIAEIKPAADELALDCKTDFDSGMFFPRI
jgi:hypothetical protein